MSITKINNGYATYIIRSTDSKQGENENTFEDQLEHFVDA